MLVEGSETTDLPAGFGNIKDMPTYIERVGERIDRAELHYSVKNESGGGSKVSYQFWLYFGDRPLAVSCVSIGGYDGNIFTVEDGVARNRKALQDVVNRINSEVRVQVRHRVGIERPKTESWKS